MFLFPLFLGFTSKPVCGWFSFCYFLLERIEERSNDLRRIYCYVECSNFLSFSLLTLLYKQQIALLLSFLDLERKKNLILREVSFLFILFRSREYEHLFLSSIFSDHKQLKKYFPPDISYLILSNLYGTRSCMVFFELSFLCGMLPLL